MKGYFEISSCCGAWEMALTLFLSQRERNPFSLWEKVRMRRYE